MEINFVKIIMTIINFIILLCVLKHFLWNKLQFIIEERENQITEKIFKANELLKESETLKLESQKILNNSKEESRQIKRIEKIKAEKIYKQIINVAKIDSYKLKEKAQAEIKMEIEKANYEVKKQIIDLSINLTQKALEREIDETEHRKIINDFINEVI